MTPPLETPAAHEVPGPTAVDLPPAVDTAGDPSARLGGDAAADAAVLARLIVREPPRIGFAERNNWHLYDVEVDGELIVAGARDPEHAVARELLARGIVGKVKIIDGTTGKHLSTVYIAAAAKFAAVDTAKGLTFAKWLPYAGHRERVTT
jgi:hypothetical protein